jgi:hypothetical protein
VYGFVFVGATGGDPYCFLLPELADPNVLRHKQNQTDVVKARIVARK